MMDFLGDVLEAAGGLPDVPAWQVPAQAAQAPAPAAGVARGRGAAPARGRGAARGRGSASARGGGSARGRGRSRSPPPTRSRAVAAESEADEVGRGRGIQAGTRAAEMRAVQMQRGRTKAHLKRNEAHQENIVVQQARAINCKGALRAGTEVKMVKKRHGKKNLTLCCRRVASRGRGKYQSVGPLCRAHMAFHPEQKLKSLEHIFDLKPKAIALNRIFTCEVFLEQQLGWLKQFRKHCEVVRPEVCCIRRAWDETRQLLCHPFHNESKSKELVRDHVEVMVSSLRMVLVFPQDPPEGGLVMDLVCPPCPLLTPSAKNILSALESHPLLNRMVEELKLIRSMATHQLEVNEFDGASGNDKLHAIKSRHKAYKEPACAYEALLCSNHAQHLVTLGVLSLLSISDTNTLLGASKFLNGNGHWARLNGSVHRVVCQKTIVTYIDDAEDDDGESNGEEYAMELCHLILRNERCDVDQDDFYEGLTENGKGSRHVQHTLFIMLQEMMAVYNTKWWGTGAGWGHRCRRDGSCCAGSSDAERLKTTHDRAARAIKQVILRKKPGQVSTNKWTKLGVGYQFFVTGHCPFAMLHTLCKEAFKSLLPRYTDALRKEELNS